MDPVNKLKIHIQNMENICFMNVSLISQIHSRIHPQLMQEPLQHNGGSQKLPVLCVQTFPPESCILTQHLRAGLLNTSPGASPHTNVHIVSPAGKAAPSEGFPTPPSQTLHGTAQTPSAVQSREGVGFQGVLLPCSHP